MVAIPFPLSTSPGQRPQEGMGRLINAYAEGRGEGGANVVWHRSPGLRVLGSDTATAEWTAWSFPFEEWFTVAESAAAAIDGQFRGGVVVASLLYGVFGEMVYTVDAAGQFSAPFTGTVAGTSKAFVFRNNNATPEVVIVADSVAYEIVGSTVIPYSDSDVGSPSCGCFHDSYFMFGYGDGKIRASGVNTTAINLIDFTTAETNPDGVIHVWSYRGQLYAAGTSTIEVYGLPINATAFPLTRVGYNITPGLIAPHCVAGFQAEFGNNPIYCASDNTVRQLNGFTPDKISPPELDALIAAVEDKSELEAICYISKGHAFWQLSSADWTWVFNCNTQKWHERKSDGLVRSRMSVSVPAFNQWLVGDTESNNLLQVDGTIATEVDDDHELLFRVESAPVKDFPNRVRVNRADFDFTVGVGDVTGADPIETDPSILISWSDDGGVTWSTPWYRKLGRQAETQQRITVLNTGMSGPMGRRWRLDVSDPIHVGLIGGTMDGVGLNK
jgi:hypothetical protein